MSFGTGIHPPSNHGHIRVTHTPSTPAGLLSPSVIPPPPPLPFHPTPVPTPRQPAICSLSLQTTLRVLECYVNEIIPHVLLFHLAFFLQQGCVELHPCGLSHGHCVTCMPILGPRDLRLSQVLAVAEETAETGLAGPGVDVSFRFPWVTTRESGRCLARAKCAFHFLRNDPAVFQRVCTLFLPISKRYMEIPGLPWPCRDAAVSQFQPF